VKRCMLLKVSAMAMGPEQTDAAGRMDAGALRAAVEESLAAGKQPFFIGSTAGTTVHVCWSPWLPLSTPGPANLAIGCRPSRASLFTVSAHLSFLLWQGAFDPLEDIAAVAEQYGLWHHVDGCWGGPVLFSAKHRYTRDGAIKGAMARSRGWRHRWGRALK
jgi:glutamate/tyrosine decarboxylase-like PLP-dependent enzyme